MNGAPLRTIAAEYAAQGLSTIVALPWSKVPLVEWKAYQYDPPSTLEREAMFSLEDSLNIGVVCGAASKNLAVIDAESMRAFETQLRRCERAGIANTWIGETWRGGHILAQLPMAVKPKSFKHDGFEVRAQGQFVLMPPSVHPSGAVYRFINRPASIIRVASLDALDWLGLQPAPEKQIPRIARYLLQGDLQSRYDSRSEAEQAIITALFNVGFRFAEILAMFKSYPAAGKFREIETTKGSIAATSWLRTCFNSASTWCATDSPARRLARTTQVGAEAAPWPGRTGSTDRAVFLAHLNLAHRSGRKVYHASSRDLAEIAGCGRITASKASRRLTGTGLLELVDPASFPNAIRYRLSEKTKFDPLPHMVLYGMDRTSSFLLPDAFRQGGLGRAAFEVLKALEGEALRAKELAQKTGRHVQTIRKSLKRLHELGYTKKSRGKWYGIAIEKIDLPELARKVGMTDARKKQREQHKAERLRCTIKMKLVHEGAEIQTRKAGQEQGV
jgi:DNA-binding transcriptional regulator YhcF (GntR family)